MASPNDELIVKIGADFKQLKAELDKAGNSVKGFSDKGKKSLEAIVQKSKELDKDTTFNTLKTELEKAGGDYEKLSKKGIAALRKLNSTTKTSTKKSGDSVAKLDKEVESSTKGVSKSFKDLDKNVEKAGRSIEKTNNSIGVSFKSLASRAGSVKLAIAAASAVVGLYVNRAAESAIETERWAMRLGMSASELSKLSNVAQLGGANLDDLTDTMKEVNIKALEAAEGNEAYRKTFQSLGIDSRTFAQLPIEQQFRAFSDAVSTADVDTQQLVRAVDDLASDAGIRMLETLKRGSKGIDEMGNSAAVTAASLSEFDFEQIKKAKFEMDRLKLSIDSLANLMLVKFSGAITAVADAAEKMAGNMKSKPISDLAKATNEWSEAVRKLKKETKEAGSIFDLTKEDSEKLKKLRDNVDRLDDIRLKEEEIAKSRQRIADLNKTLSEQDFTASQRKSVNNDIKDTQGRIDALKSQIEELKGIKSSLPDNEESKGSPAQIPEETFTGLTMLEQYLKDKQEVINEAKGVEYKKANEWRELELEREKDAAMRNTQMWESGLEGRAQVTSKVLGDMSKMMGSKNKEMFKIGKMAAMAQVAIDTPKAAMSAYSALAGIPIVGPAMGAAAAAAAIASGMTQLNNIKSQSFQGGGGGGGGASAGGMSGAATAEAPPTQVLETNVTFSGGGDISQEQFRGFVNGLNDALDDGMTIGRINA